MVQATRKTYLELMKPREMNPNEQKKEHERTKRHTQSVLIENPKSEPENISN